MRWDSQTVEQDAQGRLPGYEEAVIRRFDAPEALNTRFHEVHAKSALSKVPVQARVPFNWTVNPYRGCSHSCTYCADGATPVLMADGRTRPLEDLEVGDEIIGTERRGRYRRYVRTRVLDHWSTIKPVWEVKLEDGTRLLTSGDHRFLTERGWKHVENSPRSEPDRPHLTTQQRARGTGHFADPPRQTRGLQARIPVRPHPRRRAPARLRVSAPGRPHRPRPRLPAGSDRLRGAAPRSRVPRLVRRRDARVRVRRPRPASTARSTASALAHARRSSGSRT